MHKYHIEMHKRQDSLIFLVLVYFLEDFVMNSTELRNFIKVADLGSFEKASRILFLNPSSVIRQINSLEKETGLVLFTRTPQGVRLTPAGRCFYYDVSSLLSKMDEAVLKARTASEDQSNVISIGLTLADAFLGSSVCQKLLPFLKHHTFRIVQYRNDESELEQIRYELGSRIDIFPCCHGFASLQKLYPFFALYPTSYAVALPYTHKYGRKKYLEPGDLEGQTLYIPETTQDSSMNPFLDSLRTSGINVQLLQIGTQNLSSYNMAALSGSMLLCTEDWHIAHPSLCIKPFKTDLKVPFGFYYSQEPSDATAKLLLLLRSKGFSGEIEDLV